jgi:hypothetical protein
MKKITIFSALLAVTTGCAHKSHNIHKEVTNEVVNHQRELLAEHTKNKGFGPQAPRDIDSHKGKNTIIFSMAPERKHMNLCNIHFHKNAEHKGGEFTTYAGNGDGHGYGSGYKYNGKISIADKKAVKEKICSSSHGEVLPGDTIEVHYVYSTAQVGPGPTLGSCLSESIKNPELRVEAQVFVVVNDDKALDFRNLTKFKLVNGKTQAINIPNNTGKAINYIGSTTGPGYNEHASPFQVTWSVRPKVARVNIKTIGTWCKGNVFKEDHAHGVRNLVINPKLLSEIRK